VIKRQPADLAGARDRAVLLIGFASAIRRSEPLALELDDGKSICGDRRIRFVAGGIAKPLSARLACDCTRI
jgi:integrase